LDERKEGTEGKKQGGAFCLHTKKKVRGNAVGKAAFEEMVFEEEMQKRRKTPDIPLGPRTERRDWIRKIPQNKEI